VTHTRHSCCTGNLEERHFWHVLPCCSSVNMLITPVPESRDKSCMGATYMLHLCHTAYLLPETASLHSGSPGHHEPSPIFMHNLSSMIAEYRSDLTSRILIDERLCISWHFLICIWVKSIQNLRIAASLYLGTIISCVFPSFL
jgi:hypothetical protein